MGSDSSQPNNEMAVRCLGILHNGPLDNNKVMERMTFSTNSIPRLPKENIWIESMYNVQDNGGRTEFSTNKDCWRNISDNAKYYKMFTIRKLERSNRNTWENLKKFAIQTPIKGGYARMSYRAFTDRNKMQGGGISGERHCHFCGGQKVEI